MVGLFTGCGNATDVTAAQSSISEEAGSAWETEEAISQFVGDEESGWLVFSNGDTTYRLNYPDREPEKIGEFMFDTTYSSDGKYLMFDALIGV